MYYEFKKGELNKLFNMNQELKNIFSEYILYNNSFVLGTNKLHKGKHFALCYYELPFEYTPSYVFKFNSRAIYDAVNNNKKNIKGITIDSYKVYLTGDNDFVAYIGDALTDISLSILNNNDTLEYFSEVVSDINKGKYSDSSVVLDDSAAESMVKNNIINLYKGKYRTRISREVIPGLKKNHKIKVIFFPHDAKDLFYLCLVVDRDNVTSYHIYTCLFVR